MQSPDGKSLWRLDWDTNKGAHINWEFNFGSGQKDYYSGAIKIDGLNYEEYLSLINVFPRKSPTIG